MYYIKEEDDRIILSIPVGDTPVDIVMTYNQAIDLADEILSMCEGHLDEKTIPPARNAEGKIKITGHGKPQTSWLPNNKRVRSSWDHLTKETIDMLNEFNPKDKD